MSTSTLDYTVIAPAANRARRVLASAVLAAGASSVGWVLATDPFHGNDKSYEHVAAHRDGAWAGAVVDGVGSAAVGIGLALVLVLLVRRRGAVLATCAAVVTAIGGVLFAIGIYAGGVLAWYATDTATMPADAGGRLLGRAFEDAPGHLIIPQMIGYLALYGLGLLLAAAALWRSGTVPVWLPGALVISAVGGSVAPERIGEYAGIGQMAVLVVLAVIAGRGGQSRTS